MNGEALRTEDQETKDFLKAHERAQLRRWAVEQAIYVLRGAAGNQTTDDYVTTATKLFDWVTA